MDDGQGIKTAIDLKGAFSEAAPMQLAANEVPKVYSPSQLMPKVPATEANAKKYGLG